MDNFLKLLSTAHQRELNESEMEAFNAVVSGTPNLDSRLGIAYISVGPQALTASLAIAPHHLQPWGVANGGTYAAIAESVGSLASYIAAGASAPVMGTNNNTHFLRPSSLGDVLISTATPVHLGKTSHLWTIEHRLEESGKLCALSQLKTTIVRTPKS